MTTALVVEHIPAETAGALGSWLPEAGVELDFLRLHAGDPLPETLRHDALIVMGGPQSAYGTDAGQEAELALLRSALSANLPILGICLGAQLLAVAAGGEVTKNLAGPEYGHGLVLRTDVAAEDAFCRTVPFLPDVIHWHSDEISLLPPNAEVLCRGTHTENQAIRVGAKAWGLQFHIEVDETMVGRWAIADGVVAETVVPFPPDVDLERTWRPSVESFARIVKGGFAGTVL
jgi:GMP synthase-like glutamine amidotransferase